jgi:hypothetical protein
MPACFNLGYKAIRIPQHISLPFAITWVLCAPHVLPQLCTRLYIPENSGVSLGCPVHCSGNVRPSHITALSHKLSSLVLLFHHHSTAVSPAAAA